jgi:hypothetical protein
MESISRGWLLLLLKEASTIFYRILYRLHRWFNYLDLQIGTTNEKSKVHGLVLGCIPVRWEELVLFPVGETFGLVS